MIFSYHLAYFTTEANPNHARMDRVIAELSEDKDADVRAFFQIPQAYDSDGEPIGDISVSLHFPVLPPRTGGPTYSISLRTIGFSWISQTCHW